MTTLWAIEVTPLRGKPRIVTYTVSRLRKDAWAKYRDDIESVWWSRLVKQRQRKGLLRAVKVTIQIAEEQS